MSLKKIVSMFFRVHKNNKIIESIKTQNKELDKKEINKENIILGQLIEEGWSKKRSKEKGLMHFLQFIILKM